jgi:hypothetical protein
MIEAGLWRDRKQRKRIHQPRPRRECVGELVQVDGSGAYNRVLIVLISEGALMRKTRYLRIDEHEDAVRSLEWAEIQARLLASDCYHWKWVLISLHSAMQGFMVLALWKGNGLLTLRDDIAKEWLVAHEKDKPYPDEKLDSFLNL